MLKRRGQPRRFYSPPIRGYKGDVPEGRSLRDPQRSGAWSRRARPSRGPARSPVVLLSPCCAFVERGSHRPPSGSLDVRRPSWERLAASSRTPRVQHPILNSPAKPPTHDEPAPQVERIEETSRLLALFLRSLGRQSIYAVAAQWED